MWEWRPAEHVEHLVPTDSEKRGSHTLDISRVHPSKPDQQLRLTHHLIRPLLLVEVGAKGVSDCVGSNLVTIGIEVLYLGVVCPLVGHVEGRLDWAPVGVEPSPEEVFVELLVEIVDCIVEGKEDELRNLISSVAPGDVFASTVAILKYIHSNSLGQSSEMRMTRVIMKIGRSPILTEEQLLHFFTSRNDPGNQQSK